MNQRRTRTAVPWSSSNLCLLFLIASHLVLLNTLAVPVIAVVEGENHDGGILTGEQEGETILSSGNISKAEGLLQEGDSNDNDQTNNTTNETFGSIDDSSGEINATTTTTTTTNSSVSDEAVEREEIGSNGNILNIDNTTDTETETDSISNEEANEERLEDGSTTSPGKTAKSKKVEIEEVEKKKTMEGTIMNPLATNDNEPVDVPIVSSSSKNRSVIEEVKKKKEMGDSSTSKPQEVKEKEEMGVDTEVTEVSVEEDEEENKNDSSLEKIGTNSTAEQTKTETEIEMDTEGDEHGSIGNDDSVGDDSSESSTGDSSEAENVQDKTVTQEGEVDKPVESQEDAQEDAQGDAQEEAAKEADEKETENVEDHSSSPTTKSEGRESTKSKYPVYESSDSNEDSVIDLDAEDDIEAPKKTITEEIEDKATGSSNEVVNEIDNDDISGGVNEKVIVDEAPSASRNYSYHGEPWGQYRSTRRLPDMELLQLVFENAKNGDSNVSSGDSESQEVLKNWQNDPLYDENIAKEAGMPTAEPLIERNDSQNAGGRDQIVKQSKGSNNNVGVNAEFVEGLDDIDDFFEGVDPPDELDVGYGSSIQDVLMDKGKHILLKKVRGVARWIRIGWEQIGRNLEDRISQFQLPFQKLPGTTKTKAKTTPDLDSGAATSSTPSTTSNEKRIETGTGTEKDLKDTIITAWKTSKRAVETMSDWVDGFLDRFDKSEDDSTQFNDFDGFDLDNLSQLTQPPSS
eukprot:jgi/Psemu1/282580/fgenesh1_pg.10_\